MNFLPFSSSMYNTVLINHFSVTLSNNVFWNWLLWQWVIHVCWWIVQWWCRVADWWVTIDCILTHWYWRVNYYYRTPTGSDFQQVRHSDERTIPTQCLEDVVQQSSNFILITIISVTFSVVSLNDNSDFSFIVPYWFHMVFTKLVVRQDIKRIRFQYVKT